MNLRSSCLRPGTYCKECKLELVSIWLCSGLDFSGGQCISTIKVMDRLLLQLQGNLTCQMPRPSPCICLQLLKSYAKRPGSQAAGAACRTSSSKLANFQSLPGTGQTSIERSHGELDLLSVVLTPSRHFTFEFESTLSTDLFGQSNTRTKIANLELALNPSDRRDGLYRRLRPDVRYHGTSTTV
jgi:hypothetical protein